MNKILRFICDKKYRFAIMSWYKMLNWMSDRKYLEKAYYYRFGRHPDLDDPKTFNEKLQWLKLNDRKPIYTTMVDKYKAKKYVADRIGEQYIIPTLGVWDDPEDIDFDSLPDQFVLKCNHNSGHGMCICKDKSKLDISAVKKDLKKGLKENYYLHSREWPYKDVQRRIIAEKFMVDESGSELKDYKFFCFNGEPKYIQVDFNRFIEHKKNIYNPDWELQDFDINFPSDHNVKIAKPLKLDLMLDFARQLSKDNVFLRVDFYSINDKIYFGELTFFPGGGLLKFDPDTKDLEMGDLLDITKYDINAMS